MTGSRICAVAALLLAACGSSSSSGAAAPPPAFGGTVGGKAFSPADSSALVLGEASCTFQGTTASATGIVVGFGSFSGLCNLVTQTKSCGTKAGATIVNLLVVRANATPGQRATPVQPGTYPVAGTPTPDATGSFTVAQAFITQTGAAPSCTQPATTPVGRSGTIKIDAVGARVTGSADVTFDDGSHVSGSFDVAACGFQTDVCSALTGSGCTSETCVP
jgi:hypothetical protein